MGEIYYLLAYSFFVVILTYSSAFTDFHAR